MGKPQYMENVDHIPMEQPKTPGSVRSHPDDSPPSEAELNLLKKLRTLNGADYEAQYFDNKPVPNENSMIKKIGNPSALSIAAFGITNTLLSLFLMNVRGVKELNFMVGTFWFVGGLINLMVSVFELLVGNTFAYVIFGSLGGYFMAMGSLLTPAFGISAVYAKHPAEFSNAMGLFNFCWAAMFIVFGIVAVRANIFMVIIFTCVSVTCILEGVADFQKSLMTKEGLHAAENLGKVAGVFLLISSIPNWYLLFMILTYSAGWKIKWYTGELGIHKHKAM